MSKRSNEEIIDLSEDEETVPEITKKAKVTEEVTDLEIHNILVSKLGPGYFDLFYSPDTALEISKALVDLGYPPSFITDFLSTKIWETSQGIYGPGDDTIDDLTLADTPNYFYGLKVTTPPNIDVRKVRKDWRATFKAIRSLKATKLIQVKYTGTVPLSTTAQNWIAKGYQVNTYSQRYN